MGRMICRFRPGCSIQQMGDVQGQGSVGGPGWCRGREKGEKETLRPRDEPSVSVCKRV